MDNMQGAMEAKIDISGLYKVFPSQVDTIVFNYKGGRTELGNLVQYMHFLICRHIISRKELALMDLLIDETQKTMTAKTTDPSQEKIIEEYLKDIRFTPFYYQLWAESEPVELPALETVDGKNVGDLSKMLNTTPAKLQSAINYVKASRIIKEDSGVVRFTRPSYPEFRDWINRFNRQFLEAGDLAQSVLDKRYTYNVNGTKHAGKIILDLYSLAQSNYGEIKKKRLTKLTNMPSELNELAAFIWMVRSRTA
jgi:hypothetical protein